MESNVGRKKYESVDDIKSNKRSILKENSNRVIPMEDMIERLR